MKNFVPPNEKDKSGAQRNIGFTSFLSVTRAELKPMIDKEQLKKEKQDLKEFKKLAKEFNSAIKSSNLDYQNVIWQRVRVYIDKEIKETSSRVGTMQKSNLIRPNKMNAQDSVEMADLPQGYNPHVNGQIKNLSKEEIEKAKKQNEKIGDFVELSKNKIFVTANFTIEGNKLHHDFRGTSRSQISDPEIFDVDERRIGIVEKVGLIPIQFLFLKRNLKAFHKHRIKNIALAAMAI
ncbi:MAG: hypothetical protein IPQ10_14440 [Saprospiraceae bacterium]|nr:hypothetical protein [Saprospiraceae bacterium]